MRFIGIVTLAAALSCTPGLAQTTPTKASANAHREFTCLQMAQEGRATSSGDLRRLVYRQVGAVVIPPSWPRRS
jgi:hypothetical protein